MPAAPSSGATGGGGETVTVPITVSGFSNVTTKQFTLAWNPAVLRYAGVGDYSLGGLSAGDFSVSVQFRFLLICLLIFGTFFITFGHANRRTVSATRQASEAVLPPCDWRSGHGGGRMFEAVGLAVVKVVGGRLLLGADADKLRS